MLTKRSLHQAAPVRHCMTGNQTEIKQHIFMLLPVKSAVNVRHIFSNNMIVQRERHIACFKKT